MPSNKPCATQWNLEPEMRLKLEELRRYICFGPQDQRLLAAFAPMAQAALPTIAEHFYSRIEEFEGAKSVFKSRAQIERLKGTLRVWMQELLSGPWDEEYCCRRLRIGQRHVQVGLPAEYMFGAMSVVREQLWKVAMDTEFEPLHSLWMAINKVTDFDLALVTMSSIDISEGEALRTLQDLIIQHLPVSILCLDTAHLVTNSTNITEAGPVIGAHVDDTLPPELVNAVDVSSLIEQATIGEEVIRLSDVRTETGRHFRLTIVPVGDEHLATLVHLEEVTGIVETEVRVAHAEALARLGSMAANVAHEIRNPLAAISASIQVISSGLAPADGRAMILAKIGGQISRLNRLVTDLLVYARPFDALFEPVDSGPLIEDALLTSGVDAVVEGVDASFWADPTALTHILVNLLQNAAAAGERVVVRVNEKWVEVEDDGPGIDLVSDIFEPFVTSKAKGTGLGLAISRNLARGMGAELKLLSEAPTRFRVTFKASQTC